MRTDWFEDFFHGLAVEFWRRAVPAEETVKDVNFIEAELGLARQSRILDIPCGNGRHSIELAKRGYSMTAVDLCHEFLVEARQTAINNAALLDCVRMDMRAFHFKNEFDGAFCFGNSFGYMDRTGNESFIQNIHRCLRPGARFIVETGIAAESLLPGLQARRWHRVGDIVVLAENCYDPAKGELRTEYTFIRGETVESGAATYCVYTVGELKELFRRCGFALTEVYGTRERDPYRLGDRLFLVATTRVGS